MALINPNRFYVYLHKRKDTGEVFYVGKGTRHRCKSLSNRSKSWLEIVEAAGGLEVSFPYENLEEEEALYLEGLLIKNPDKNWNLVNLPSRLSTDNLMSGAVKEYSYIENNKSCLQNSKGINVGYKHTDKKTNYCQWVLKYKKRSILVSRLIYNLFFGEVPKNAVIDHIDGNPLNNNIENLRAVSRQINSKNRVAASSITNIHYQCYKHVKRWDKATGRFLVHWSDVNGKRKNKAFYINSKRTKDEAEKLAVEFRNKIVAEGLILVRNINGVN